jgi:hypothetical protein
MSNHVFSSNQYKLLTLFTPLSKIQNLDKYRVCKFFEIRTVSLIILKIEIKNINLITQLLTFFAPVKLVQSWFLRKIQFFSRNSYKTFYFKIMIFYYLLKQLWLPKYFQTNSGQSVPNICGLNTGQHSKLNDLKYNSESFISSLVTFNTI